MAKRQNDDMAVHESSGNVFADLGLPHSPADMLKVEIMPSPRPSGIDT